MRHNYERLRDPSWVTVCADGTLEEVGEQLYSVVMAEVDREARPQLGKLWVEAGDSEAEMEVASTASSSQTDSD